MPKTIKLDYSSPQKLGRFAFLHLGFRPFFIGASSFAFIAILLWMGIYTLSWPFTFSHLPPMTWHAHEMIFGYSIAVIAGFLLTATKNWTGMQTLHGYPLLGLFGLWGISRLLFLFGNAVPLEFIAISDILFIGLLTISVCYPLLKTKQWKNIIFVGLLILLGCSNMVFYLGAFGGWFPGIYYGLYAGLYLVLTFIFIMGRRIIPFFIEKGLGYPVQLKNWPWIDKTHLILFGAFASADLINPNSYLTAGLAGLTAFVHGLTLIGWYQHGIWKKPLLWILYLGYVFIVLGFILKVLAILGGISVYLAVHAFAVGGIGMITLGMMARVSIGHTGRNVLAPPHSLFWIFGLLSCSAFIRIIFPLINASFYLWWIALAQLFWLFAFGWFLVVFLPMLIYPRTDGHYG